MGGGGDIGNIRENYRSLTTNPLAQRPFLNAIISYAKIILDDTMQDAQKLDALYAILGQNINMCRLNYDQLLIVNQIALTHARLNQQDKAIALLDGVVQNADTLLLTATEKLEIMPKQYVDLTALLVQAGDYPKAAELCKDALKRYRVAMLCLPTFAYTLGVCYHKMNKDKPEYTHWLTVAYHAARGIGQNALADKIRQEWGIQ